VLPYIPSNSFFKTIAVIVAGKIVKKIIPTTSNEFTSFLLELISASLTTNSNLRATLQYFVEKIQKMHGPTDKTTKLRAQ
jgi:hypothetical protein